MKKLIIAMGMLGVLSGCSTNEQEAFNALNIPQLIDTAETDKVELVLHHAQHEFYAGVSSDTMAINGTYLGPVIRLHKGTDANISFRNGIGESTTIHGHGLHVNGDVDGGPQQKIAADETWDITIPVRQQAGMSWYHPHLMGKTAEHVYNGLAGVYLIEDDNSKALDLPKNYGVNDIPLIVQDRNFANGKMLPYSMTQEQMMDGFRGETLVVNGTVAAYHNVPKGWVRLRLLNGSNARFYRFHLSDKSSFYKIATEGGFLNKPVALTQLDMAPGERNEIMVNMSSLSSIKLMAELLPADPGVWPLTNPVAQVVELRADAELPATGTLPEKLNNIQFYTAADAKNANLRTFSLDMEDGDAMPMDMHHMFSINGQSMDMKVINERVKQGQLEVWRITADMMPHPFHIHGVSFQILSHNGVAPAEADRGWKDTVVVTGEPTDVIMRFDYLADVQTPYMYHCHILEHEDGGMMGQFTVQ